MQLTPLTGTFTPLGAVRRRVVAVNPYHVGLVAWWELDESGGSQRNDAHTNGYHLSDIAGVAQATGQLDWAAQFDRVNREALSRASNADLGPGDSDFMFAAWFKVDALANDGQNHRFLISKDTGSAGGRCFGMFISVVNSLPRFFVTSDGATPVFVTAASAITAGVWNHIFAWHDSANNQLGLRINGGSVVTASHGAGVFTNSAIPFRLGAASVVIATTTTLNGALDATAMWSRILTTDEQNYIYNSGAGRRYNEL